MADIWRVVGQHLRAVRAGTASGEARFRALYDAHGRRLLAYALRRVDRPDDAADVVAETMLVAWRRLDDVPDGLEARLWLFGVARRVLANQRRGGRRRDRLGEKLRQELRSQVGLDPAPMVVVGVDLQAAFAGLSAEDREVLQLTAWEGLEPTEIATVLGLSPVAVRSRLHRARGRLRERLEEGRQRRPGGGHVGHDEQPLVRDAEDER